MIMVSGVNYLREKEVSKKYGLSLPWLRRARVNHNGPIYHKLNYSVYYKEEQIEEWLKHNMVANG